jgi:hypothetical protein
MVKNTGRLNKPGSIKKAPRINREPCNLTNHKPLYSTYKLNDLTSLF